jgi:hypothetical protein
MGLGYYGAPRGKFRKHNGTDFLCIPGQSVYCPIESGKVVRRAKPYSDDQYQGCLIEGKNISIKLFYVDVWEHMIGTYVKRNDEIGIAQDISAKYGSSMKPHVHLTITSIDPELLIKA